MRYDLSNPFHAKQARARLEKLISKGATADLTEKTARTYDQNSYLHLAIRYLATRLGERPEYVKDQYYKRYCNADLFIRKRFDIIMGKEVTYVRSSKELSVEEMSLSINRFLDFAARELNEPIPTPDEYRLLMALETEVERTKQYVY